MSWYNPWTWRQGAAYQAGALTNPDTGDQVNRPPPTTTAANISVTDERAMQVSTVFACTRLIAQTCASLPLGFYTRTPDGREPLPEDHYLTRLLKYKPNNLMNALEFRTAMFSSRVLWGNSYCKIERLAGKPIALLPMKPEYMTVERHDMGLVYKYSTKEGTKKYAQSDILHLRGWSTDGIMGMSPLGFARQSLGLSVSADNSASKAVNGRANAVLEMDDIPTDAQKAKLREMYGAGNVTTAYGADGQLMIIPGGMKYRAISMNPDDLQLLESRQFSVIELARFFGVPSVMIDGAGASSAAWPASYEQQQQSFLTYTLKPYIEEFESKIVDSLIPESEKRKLIVEHKVDGLLRADSAGRSAFYNSGLQNGWMTVNEVRMKENMPKSEDAGADELHAQVNMAPLGQLGEQNAVKQN